MSKKIFIVKKDTGSRVVSGQRIKKERLDSNCIMFGEHLMTSRGGEWFKMDMPEEEMKISTGNQVSEHWLEFSAEVNSSIFISHVDGKHWVSQKRGDDYYEVLTNTKITNSAIRHKSVEALAESEGWDYVGLVCLDTDMPKCYNCGEETTELFQGSGSTVICSTCMESHHNCAHCGCDYYGDTSVDGYCNNCGQYVGECDECGETHYLNYRETTDGSTRICSSCYEAAERCDDCQVIIRGMSHENVDSRSGCLCGRCHDRQLSRGVIRNYSYKPSPDFRGIGDEKLFFGVELELNVPTEKDAESVAAQCRSDFREANEDGKLFYCKSDSSIGHGFELVTHPFSKQWLDSDQQTISSLFDILGNNNCRSGKRDGISSCGMHVHMSKNAFTDAQIAKYMLFVYSNKKFIQFISDRTSASQIDCYCRLSNSAGTVSDYRKLAKQKYNLFGLGHTSAIQMTDHTIEFRIFNSTMVEYEFLKNIEFCQALYDFTASTHIRNMTSEKFIEFVKSNSNDYAHLVTFVNMFEMLTNIGSQTKDEYPEILKKSTRKDS